MVPLSAGGRGTRYRPPSGLEFSVFTAGPHRIAMLVACVLVAAQAALCLGVSRASAGEGAGVSPAPGRSGAVVVGVFAPGAVRTPVGDADWTLRSEVAAARAAEANDQAVARRYAGRAGVSVFPWREVLFYAMVAVAVIVGLLAFSGGHHRQSRHS